MILDEAQKWIGEQYVAGAKQIGVTCNPIRRKLYVSADKNRIVFDCRTQVETRIMKDILHEYIGRLPKVDK